MLRSLYDVLEDTRTAAAAIRTDGLWLEPPIDEKLRRFEAAVEHALASSPDGETVAQAEELVALNALSDLHLALQNQPVELRERLRPIVDEWIAYAASTGLTPQELARSATHAGGTDVETWLRTAE